MRKVNHTTGIITTVAGNSTAGYSGDGGPATKATLSYPTGLAFDTSKTYLYISDTANNVVRKMDTVNGTIKTVAGSSPGGYSGDGGAATKGSLWAPYGLAVDRLNNLYISDYDNHVIRKVSAFGGIITTFAGNSSTPFYTGDGQNATSTGMSGAYGIACDAAGNLFYADSNDNLVRKVNHTTGIVTTVVGNWSLNPGCGPFGGSATKSTLNYPGGLAFDASGNLFIADVANNDIEKVYA